MRAEELLTPTLLVHLDRVRANIAAMLRHLGGRPQRWRPHVKTAKLPEVCALLLQAGVRRAKCATTREAEVLFAVAGPEPLDLLVAMAMHGPNLQQVAALARAHPQHRLAVLSEDPAHAAAVRALGLGVFVDLDPGFHRTGIPFADPARIDAVLAAAGPALRGLHCYEGHLHDGTPAARAAAAAPIHRQLLDLARRAPAGLELCTSGTPSFPAALACRDFAAHDHTVGPGTVVYWDARSQRLGIDGFVPAVEVQARVVANPAPDRCTVDAGSKALDAAAGDPCAEVTGAPHLQAQHPSEEHLPIRALAGRAPPPGALLRLLPTHVCPTVNLADEAVLLDGGEVVAVVPVRARGHSTLPAGGAPPPR